MEKMNRVKRSLANQGNKSRGIKKVYGVFFNSREGRGCSKVDIMNLIS